MRRLTKKQFTKAERIFGEMLKDLRIPFKTKIHISGREVDFLIGNYAIEIDGHPQESEKNNLILEAGFTPVHISNRELRTNKSVVFNWLKEIKI